MTLGTHLGVSQIFFKRIGTNIMFRGSICIVPGSKDLSFVAKACQIPLKMVIAFFYVSALFW